MTSLKGKTALVTGSTRGIGSATAASLAEMGATVIVNGRTQEAVDAALAKLRAPVDAFFDKVTVNADKPEIRENRLMLLAQIRALTLEIADFSKIEG